MGAELSQTTMTQKEGPYSQGRKMPGGGQGQERARTGYYSWPNRTSGRAPWSCQPPPPCPCNRHKGWTWSETGPLCVPTAEGDRVPLKPLPTKDCLPVQPHLP